MTRTGAGRQRGIAVANAAPCTKKDGWPGRPARAGNRGGRTAGRCSCPRGTLSKKDGWPRQPARAVNRGGDSGALWLLTSHHIQKRRLAWPTGACREPGQGDSGALRLRTMPCVQTSGQGVYYRTKTEAQTWFTLPSALLWLCSLKELSWHHCALCSGWYFVNAAVKSASVAALFSKMLTNSSSWGKVWMLATCCSSCCCSASASSKRNCSS